MSRVGRKPIAVPESVKVTIHPDKVEFESAKGKLSAPLFPGIVARLSRSFSLWILAANLIAWPIAYFAMIRWLRGFAYRTDLGLDLFVAAGLVSLLAAVLPIVYQALKAAVDEPVKALLYE